MTEGIVDFSDWQKLDLRVAQIKKVEDVKEADKLYKLILDVGSESMERVVCAGLKPYYNKKELEDKKIILFVNLEPKRIKGIESRGMILAAVDKENDKVILISP